MITIEQMVQREVNCCLSSLVSTLDHGHALSSGPFNKLCGIADLIEQAHELAGPVLDYEEAATQAGWRKEGNSWRRNISPNAIIPIITRPTAQEACERDEIDPYEREVFEHWSVSQWLADKLLAQGEKVDTDFAGMCVWARTTTGQAISMDGCIQRIYADMMAPHTLDSVAPGA